MPGIFLRRCAKLHSSVLPYRYLTNFKVIPLLAFCCLTADACGLPAACTPTQLPYWHAVLRKYQQHKFIRIGPFARAGPCLTLWRARLTNGESEA
jgi:hypothetical protein